MAGEVKTAGAVTAGSVVTARMVGSMAEARATFSGHHNEPKVTRHQRAPVDERTADLGDGRLYNWVEGRRGRTSSDLGPLAGCLGMTL